ncbi:hypothetical protein ABMA28_015013 [Loxostege sticticalis]|uniref:FP protein C-terminal domain-containing protein n=1 Tax=Loxostege sticticalis TaxID=481309 RepID=A0ABD0TDY2_LOXSC
MDSSMNRSLSDSDVHSISQQDLTPTNFVSQRGKRKREDEFTSEFEEMKALIANVIASQEKEFKKNATILKEIQHTNHNIENSIAFLTAQNEDFRKKIESLEAQVKEDKSYITVLESKVEDMQKDRRKANFEIKNAPKKEKETKEDLIDMVVCLSKNIGCELSKNNITDIYRIRGKKNSAQNTPIIVETSSALLKNEVIKLSKAFNIKHKTKLCAKHLGHRTSEDTPIFISEHLTAKAARLYFLARDVVKMKSYKFCWTSYGKVYLRKDEMSPILLVNNESQIHQLLNAI